MEQTSLLSVNPGLIFWTLVTFVVLLMLLIWLRATVTTHGSTSAASSSSLPRNTQQLSRSLRAQLLPIHR